MAASRLHDTATTIMALPLPTPKPPAPRDDYTGLEDLDRPELDEAPDTDPMLTPLDWDTDQDSGIVTKRKKIS